MSNWFKTRPYTFENVVTKEGDIRVGAFILASQTFIDILTLAPNTIFKAIHSQCLTDYEVILRVYTSQSEEKTGLMTQILNFEQATANGCLHRACMHATYRVLVLSNGFEFLVRVCEELLADPLSSKSLSVIINEAFAATIARCHTALTGRLLSTALRACPDKQALIAQLIVTDTLEETIRTGNQYLVGLRQVRDALNRMVHKYELGLAANRPDKRQ